MYDRNLTEASKGALLEICMALNMYRGDFVLVGGWAPYFISREYFDHCGSIDIDLVLKPEIIQRYQSIKDIIESLGYTVTNNPFRFERTLLTLDSTRSFDLHLDFLTEPEAALNQNFLIEVQEDLRACLIPGISIVFNHYNEQELEAVLPDDGEAVHSIDVVDILGALTTKGNALPRLKDKDSYDIYAITGFSGGSPIDAAQEFMELIHSRNCESDPVINQALNIIRNGFSSPTRYGCVSAARFIGSNGQTQNEIYQRVSAFIENTHF